MARILLTAPLQVLSVKWISWEPDKVSNYDLLGKGPGTESIKLLDFKLH